MASADDAVWLLAEATAALALHTRDEDGTCRGCRDLAGAERSWDSCSVTRAAEDALTLPGRLAALTVEGAVRLMAWLAR